MVIDKFHVFLALVLGLFVGGIAGYIGSLMTTKRMALVGDALGHLALPGISLALLYHFDVSLGALLFLVFGMFFIWLLEIKTHLPFESLTAVVFAISLAITFLILPEEELEVALLGDISRVSPTVVVLSCISSVVIFLFLRKIFSGIMLSVISEDLAKVQRIEVKRENFIYLLCIILTVALIIRMAGGLMIAALISIPAATSNNLSSSLYQYSIMSLFLGALSCCIGILLNIYTGAPVASLIIITSGVFFFISLFFKKT